MTRAATAALLAALAIVVPAVAGPAVAEAQRRPDLSSARSAILIETSTGDVVLARRPDERRSIASTTKLMTALVTVDRASLRDVYAAARYDALPVESQIDLRAGERMNVRDLLRALLLESANDAAVTLAVGTSGSRSAFVREMNRQARRLGLRNTHYANPVGLDEEGNYSSARDLAKLATVLRRNAFLRETVDLPRATLRSGDRTRTIDNRNRLVLTVPSVDGVKTGRTQQAGYVLVGSATRDGVSVVSAVLGEPSEGARDADTLALLRYGLSRYRRTTAVRRGAILARARVRYADEPVEAAADRTVRRVVRRGERMTVRIEDVPRRVEGPLPRGSRIGTAVVRHRGDVVARVALRTTRDVEEAPLATRLTDALVRPWTVLLLGVLLGCSLPLVVLRRRAMRRRGSRPRQVA